MTDSTPLSIALLPLRDVVVFPNMVIPLFVGRPKSIKALETGMQEGTGIMLVAQKNATKDEPETQDLHQIGCIANILQMLKLPDGTVKVLVEGTQRARLLSIHDNGEHFSCTAELLESVNTNASESEALRRAVLAQFDQFVKLNKQIPPEVLTSVTSIDDVG